MEDDLGAAPEEMPETPPPTYGDEPPQHEDTGCRGAQPVLHGVGQHELDRPMELQSRKEPAEYFNAGPPRMTVAKPLPTALP